MKKILLINLLLILPLFAQVQKYTLQQSLTLGLQNSKDMKISQSKLSASSARITEVTSQMLPQLKFGAGYTRLSSVPPFEVVVPFSPLPIKLSDVILNNYNLRLSVQQPLFTGFRLLSQRDAAEMNSKAAETDLVKDMNEAAFKIQNAFWQFYKADQMLSLLNENLAQNAKHLEDTKNNLQNGLVTQNDLLKLQVQYSNTKLQQIEAQNNLDIARVGFNQAIGVNLNSPSRIDAGEIVPEPADNKFEDLLNEARQNLGELKSLAYRLEAGKDAVRAARSGWLPSVYVNANYYYNRPNQRYQPPLDQFKDTWDVGISLNWDLWNWGLTSSQVRQAQEQAVQTETSLSQLNEAVEIEVYSNFLAFGRSNEKIEVSRQAVAQAAENTRITNEKFNAQLATSTDLIDAETALLQARTNYNNALVDYELAKARLEKSIGRKIY